MPIKSLQIKNVGVFGAVDFTFDSQVNVFVGPNNTGKTTALFTLADIAVDPFTFPRKHIRKNSQFSVLYEFKSKGAKAKIEGSLPISGTNKKWSSEKMAKITSVQKKLGFSIFIPALRVGTDFRSKGPTVADKDGSESEDSPLHRSRYLEQLRMNLGEDVSPNEIGSSFIRDESIIQDLINFDYQAYRENNPAVRKTIERIASVGSRITEGFPVSFAGVNEDKMGLFPSFVTPDGKMPLSVLSQGTQGLLLWLTRFIIGYARHYDFPKSFANKPGVLIIDEIDAHLHPNWQRRIIPELTAEFPSLQIFCSTHSPLMIAGLKRGQVQLLRRDDKGKITVSQNETDVKGWSADEIYSCFLDIDNPTDLQTDSALERLELLRSKRRNSPSESAEIKRLKTKVGSLLRNTPSNQNIDEMADALKKAAKEIPSQKTVRPTKAKK